MNKTVRSEFVGPEKARNWPCARGLNSAVSTRIDHPLRSAAADDRSRVATYLASLAVRVLIEEAELTPKPALVDERGPGAHTDLSLTLMKSSAGSIRHRSLSLFELFITGHKTNNFIYSTLAGNWAVNK
jgi:ATP:dephospho-CoA triphosphoribosyl transferase